MYDFDRIVKAAESCEFHSAFASDIKLCENALGMGGLMGINAECWLDILNIDVPAAFRHVRAIYI